MFLGVVLLDFEKVAVVHHRVNDVFDVVGQVRLVGNNSVQLGVGAVDGIGAGLARRVVEIVRRHEAQQLAHHGETFGVVVGQKMGHAGGFVVGVRAAQLVFSDFLVSDRLDHVRAGDEHVGSLVDHENEIGDGGRVDGAAGAGAHDGGNLRNDSAVERVAQENVGVAGQRHYAFLNAGAARVVQADDGSAHLCGEVHDLDDLGGVGFGERAAENGEILGEDEDQPALDAAVAGDEAVAVVFLLGHAEVVGAMRDQLVGLLEGAFVEQELDALAGRHFAFFVLALAALLSAAVFGQLIARLQFGEFLFEVHGGEIIAGQMRKQCGNHKGHRGSAFRCFAKPGRPRRPSPRDCSYSMPAPSGW